MKLLTRAPKLTTEQEIKYINVAGAIGMIYFRLAMGDFLLFFATKCLNVSGTEWAKVQSVLAFTVAFQLVSAYIVERFGGRKWLSIGATAIARLSVPAIAVLPYFTSPADHNLRLFYIGAALVARSALEYISASPWMSWVADIVPENERGKFYAKRFMITTTVDVSSFIIMGFVLDVMSRWRGDADPLGYVVIFAIGFICGEIDQLIFLRVKDRPLKERQDDVKVSHLLAAPWRHSGFRRLMLFRIVIALADGFCGPFIFIYQTQTLKITPFTYSVLVSITLISVALSYRLWQNVGEKYGYRTVATMSYMLMSFCAFYWWFVPEGRPLIFLPVFAIASVNAGCAAAGVNLSMNTLILNVAPKKHFSMFFAQIMTVLSIASGSSIAVGAWVYTHTNPIEPVYFLGTKLTGLHVLIGVVAIIRIFCGSVLSFIIPDERSEATYFRFAKMVRQTPLRFVPALFSFDRPLTPEEREKSITTVLALVPQSQDSTMGEAMRTVLADVVNADEFHQIMSREESRPGAGIAALADDIPIHASPHLTLIRAKAAARRIRSLYESGDFYGCLRTVRRLANQAAVDSERARLARHVISALANDTAPPCAEAALLGIYAFLQIVREPHRPTT